MVLRDKVTDGILRVRAVFSGRVQGVFFRANAKRFADELAVAGWVRNTDSGEVEAAFEGDGPSVRKVIERCRTEQPYARITSVKVEEEEPKGDLRGFKILY